MIDGAAICSSQQHTLLVKDTLSATLGNVSFELACHSTEHDDY